MICPVCWGTSGSAVIDSRPYQQTIRRRRQCLVASCQHRFTTYEVRAVSADHSVIPKDLAPRLKSIEREAKDLRLLLERNAS